MPKAPHILLLIMVLMLAFSCRKGSIETNYNPSISVANSQVIAERAYSEVFNLFLRVVNDSVLHAEGYNNIYGANCLYTTANGIEYSIDYADVYVNCPDGKFRKGRIMASLNKPFDETGAVASLSFTGYTVNDLVLEGDNDIYNSGLSAGALQMYGHEVPSATLSFYDSTYHGSIHWESSKTYIWVQGKGTPDFDDDVFEIIGTGSGADVNGVVFSAGIAEPLTNDLSCRWIRSGRTNLSTPGLDVKSGYIEYPGQDSCTNLVYYYFNGNPFFETFGKH